MKQLGVLLQAEYRKRRNSYWLPVWIILGITLLMALIVAVVVLGKWGELRIGFSDFTFHYNEFFDAIRASTYIITISMAFIFVLVMLVNSQSSLSKEKELGCELFYRCQPANTWLTTFSRYLMHIYANSLLLLALGVIVALINTIIAACSIGGFHLATALYGSFLAWLIYLKICVVFGSYCFFFSSIFTGNAFFKGTAVLAVVELVFFLIEELFHNKIQLPNIFQSLFAMIGNFKIKADMSISIVSGDLSMLAALIFAATAYIAATLIYKYKGLEN